MSNPSAELHPSFRSRLARATRFARNVKGQWRIADSVAGRSGVDRFRVRNDSGWFEGSLDSLIERQIYLTGGYEEPLIDTFLSLFPNDRRRCVLDVGANVGTHSLAFARHFDRVICFEPNVDVFASLTRNLALNPGAAVTPINCGLGDVAGTRPFYNVLNGNRGLGTFLETEQYDVPIERIADFPVVRGDDVLGELLPDATPIDAIKLDIQGYEPNALRGLRETLARHRPTVWVEFGGGTLSGLAPGEAFSDLFPYAIEVLAFRTERTMLVARTRLEALQNIDGMLGDVVVRPLG